MRTLSVSRRTIQCSALRVRGPYSIFTCTALLLLFAVRYLFHVHRQGRGQNRRGHGWHAHRQDTLPCLSFLSSLTLHPHYFRHCFRVLCFLICFVLFCPPHKSFKNISFQFLCDACADHIEERQVMIEAEECVSRDVQCLLVILQRRLKQSKRHVTHPRTQSISLSLIYLYFFSAWTLASCLFSPIQILGSVPRSTMLS